MEKIVLLIGGFLNSITWVDVVTVLLLANSKTYPISDNINNEVNTKRVINKVFSIFLNLFLIVYKKMITSSKAKAQTEKPMLRKTL